MQTTAKTKATILSVAGWLAVVVILLVLALTVWSPPGKQDFEAARSLTDRTHQSYQVMTEAADRYLKSFTPLYDRGLSPSEVATATTQDRKIFERAYQRHTDDLEKLGSHKALRDDLLSKKFTPYEKHDTSFSTYMKNYLESWPLYLKATRTTCNDVFSVVKTVEAKDTSSKQYFAAFAKAHQAAAKDCLNDLDVLSKSKNGPMSNYAEKFADFVRTRQNTMERTASDELAIASAQQQLLVTLPSDFKTINNEFATKYQKDISELAAQEQFEAFEKAVNKKTKETD